MDSQSQIRRLVERAWHWRFCPPPWTVEDLYQQTNLRLCESEGPLFLDKLASGKINRKQLQKVVCKAVEDARGRYVKQRRNVVRKHGPDGPLAEVLYDQDMLKKCQAPCRDWMGMSNLLMDIQHEIERFSERDRRIIELKREGNSIDEIANETGVSAATIKRSISKFRSRIAAILRSPNE